MIRLLLCTLDRHSAPHPYFSWQRNGTWEGECPVCLALIRQQRGGRWRRDKPTAGGR